MKLSLEELRMIQETLTDRLANEEADSAETKAKLAILLEKIANVLTPKAGA